LKTLGILGNFGFVGNLYLLTRKVDAAELSNRLHVGLMEMGGEILGSSGPLAHGDGLIVRVLGNSSAAVRGALETCWDTIRKSILHVPAPKTRKY
jgi:urease accessory protein UreH